MTFRTAYGPKLKVQHHTPPNTGRTKQSFKDECDINKIMSRFEKTGVLDFATRYEPRYADVTGVSFSAAMDVVAQANSMFHAMPARVRDRFQNDPGKFFDFVQNPNNREEAEALGLLKDKSQQEREKALDAQLKQAGAPAPTPASAPAAAPAPAAPQTNA